MLRCAEFYSDLLQISLKSRKKHDRSIKEEEEDASLATQVADFRSQDKTRWSELNQLAQARKII